MMPKWPKLASPARKLDTSAVLFLFYLFIFFIFFLSVFISFKNHLQWTLIISTAYLEVKIWPLF